MDNWADPWADNADSAKSPTKTDITVTSPLPPTVAPAPSLLNGFLDDAGWGNDDESFGDWSAAPAQLEHAAPAKTSMSESYIPQAFEPTSDDIQWASDVTSEPHVVHNDGDWAGVALDSPRHEDKVASETSDSSTAMQDEAAEAVLSDSPEHVKPDDESSNRASTSPSETSHTDMPVESPRTSNEDERGAAKLTNAEDVGHDASFDLGRAASSAEDPESAQSGEWNNQDVTKHTPAVEEDVQDGVPSAYGSKPSPTVSGIDTVAVEDAPRPPNTETRTPAKASTYAIDPDLLRDLFAPTKDSERLDEAPDSPIYSTSARRAWYRLTRKQTMREYNNGNDDDNYIHVTWANSHIRAEVNKVVGRWAREDRISGTGPGARASFYWDTPAPADNRAPYMHTRQLPSHPVSNVVAPMRDSVPALSTNAPAAFDWSSPAVSVDPWHQNSAVLGSASSPTAVQPQVAHVQSQEARGPSLHPTSHKPDPATGMQTSTARDETPAVATLISPPAINNNGTPSSDPWADLDTLKTVAAPKSDPATASADDEDDEWGDMVSSPVVATPTATPTRSQSITYNDIASTPSTPPQRIKASPYQDGSPETMHAAPIVRLKSIVSPTSALFKTNRFVPLGPELGPIGPGILKSSKRVVSVTATKTVEKSPSPIEPTQIPVVEPETVQKPRPPDEFFEWQTSVPEGLVEEKVVNSEPPTVTPETSPRPTTPDEFSAWQTPVHNIPVGDKRVNVEPSRVIPETLLEPDSPDEFSAWHISGPKITGGDERMDAEASIVTPETSSRPKTPDEFSAWQTSVPDILEEEKQVGSEPPAVTLSPVHNAVRPSIPPPAAEQPAVDAWADADFSFFETSLPAAPPPKTEPDSSDSFSGFGSRIRSISSASSANRIRSISSASSGKHFSRSPPPKVPSPPVQPLTGATSSAQRRKIEEDQIIHAILSGLPDLNYMLRR